MQIFQLDNLRNTKFDLLGKFDLPCSTLFYNIQLHLHLLNGQTLTKIQNVC
jgi:hypothetical protein